MGAGSKVPRGGVTLYPRTGSVARCGAGRIGVITQDKPIRVEYADGNEREAYVGVHIWPVGWIGKPWSSTKPEVLVQLNEDWL